MLCEQVAGLANDVDQTSVHRLAATEDCRTVCKPQCILGTGICYGGNAYEQSRRLSMLC